MLLCRISKRSWWVTCRIEFLGKILSVFQVVEVLFCKHLLVLKIILLDSSDSSVKLVFTQLDFELIIFIKFLDYFESSVTKE